MVLPPAGKLVSDMASLCPGHEAGRFAHQRRHHGARGDDFAANVSSAISLEQTGGGEQNENTAGQWTKYISFHFYIGIAKL
jgi:hypothetical protein